MYGKKNEQNNRISVLFYVTMEQ